MKIYAILACTGYPEDSYNWLEGWATTKEKAEAHVAVLIAQDEARKPRKERKYSEHIYYEVMEAEELP